MCICFGSESVEASIWPDDLHFQEVRKGSSPVLWLEVWCTTALGWVGCPAMNRVAVRIRSHRSSLNHFVAFVQFTIVMHLVVRRIKLIFNVKQTCKAPCALYQPIHFILNRTELVSSQSPHRYDTLLVPSVLSVFSVCTTAICLYMRDFHVPKKTGWLLALCKMASSNHYIPRGKLTTHCQVRTLCRSY